MSHQTTRIVRGNFMGIVLPPSLVKITGMNLKKTEPSWDSFTSIKCFIENQSIWVKRALKHGNRIDLPQGEWGLNKESEWQFDGKWPSHENDLQKRGGTCHSTNAFHQVYLVMISNHSMPNESGKCIESSILHSLREFTTAICHNFSMDEPWQQAWFDCNN